VAGSVLATVAAVCLTPLAAQLGTVPPSVADVGWALTAAAFPAVVVEITKALRRRASGRQG
jgi:hypothetical protein